MKKRLTWFLLNFPQTVLFFILTLLLTLFLFFFFWPYPWHMEVPRLEGSIGATAACLCHSHSNAGSELHLWPTPQLTTPQIRPVSKARGRTHNLMVPSQISFCCTTTGPPKPNIFRVHPSCGMHQYSPFSWLNNIPLVVARPGIEPPSSRILVRFISDVPLWELLPYSYFHFSL